MKYTHLKSSEHVQPRRANFTFRRITSTETGSLGASLAAWLLSLWGLNSDKHIFLHSVVKETFINVFISGKKYGGASQFFIFI